MVKKSKYPPPPFYPPEMKMPECDPKAMEFITLNDEGATSAITQLGYSPFDIIYGYVAAHRHNGVDGVWRWKPKTIPRDNMVYVLNEKDEKVWLKAGDPFPTSGNLYFAGQEKE